MADKKGHKTSYPLAILLNMLSTIALVGGIAFFGFVKLLSLKDKTKDTGFFTLPNIALIVAILGIIQFLALKIPLKKMLNKAVLDNEYDEFGRSKKTKYENLTRQQREQMDLQKAAQMEQLLSSSVIKKITKKGSSNPEKDLNSLIGLTDVKQKVTEMVARMKFERDTAKDKKGKQNKSEYGMNGRHFCFYGSAGTGKTTVARIIAGFLYENGYIKENKVIEINGGFLKEGEYSETKTKLVIQQAYGGVLFIDEAYSIIEGNANYGKAAVAELIKEMEDNRDKFTVILAGYKNDMKRLVDTNEGFKSRIKEYLEFPDYSVDEMCQIFGSMAHSSGFGVSADAMDNFVVRASKEKELPSFGNGRTVRNILDEAIDRHALNYGMGTLTYDGKENNDCKFVLCGMDISTVPNKKVL
jgi:stage V sporulation protein K